ncbi:vacuolar fusion protein MON1 homolog B-like [Rhincodon typus]|uniref:vacuolar fusion protein MON1 homolog B-like n=1 Tax=Rhincodon typus TaxID=259920 RepID=UPI002030A4E5|nr:vacuolar fusion protein MON1 homolog B-like [Rhincodon typus]
MSVERVSPSSLREEVTTEGDEQAVSPGEDTPTPGTDAAGRGWQRVALPGTPPDEEEEDSERELSDTSSAGNAAEDPADFLAQPALLGRGGAGSPGRAPCPRSEDVTAEAWRAHRKHVFVLSEAGKPIYSRYGNEEALSSTMGVMMALVSFVQDGDNTIRSIQSDDYKVVFSQHGPLVLVSVSRSHQSPAQLRRELCYVYYQIISLLTQATVTRIFQHKKNYDLRRLLAGSERILDNLLRRLDTDPGFLLGAVQCLPLAPSLREAVSYLLLRAVTPNLVFSILLAQGRLVSIVQERAVLEDTRLHPADLHLLFNLLAGSSAPPQAGELWTPVCLPRLYPDSYFYAYVSYLDPAHGVCLLLLSTDQAAFYSVAACKRRIEEGLRAQGLLAAIQAALRVAGGAGASRLGLSELRHFMYKPLDIPDNHRQLTQYTSPEIEAPYTTEQEKEHLFDLYQYLHSKIHSSTRPLKLIYHVAERETLLAWVTGKFELYACYSPLVTKAAAISIVTKVLRWIRKEEAQLFIHSPAKYSTTPSPGRSPQGPELSRLESGDNGFPSLL